MTLFQLVCYIPFLAIWFPRRSRRKEFRRGATRGHWLEVLRLHSGAGGKKGSGVRSNSSVAHTDFRLDFQPSAGWTAARLSKSSWSPVDYAIERANTWKHKEWKVSKTREAPMGQRMFLNMWMYSSFKSKTRQPLSILLTHENEENLNRGKEWV